MKLAIIDIETNGSPQEITEIAVVVCDESGVIEKYESLVKPRIAVPLFITRLTGITNEMLEFAPRFSEIAEEINRSTADCVFVAHHVNFDYPIVRKHMQNFGINYQRKKLCSVRMARKMIPGRRSYGLGNICRDLNIVNQARHRAMGDAFATWQLVEIMRQNEGFDDMCAQMLNTRTLTSAIPSHVDSNSFLQLPEATGIYFFYDRNQKLIYVGKAKNIRKRVLSHFYDKSRSKIELCREMHSVSYELSGSETLALLMEDKAIKKFYPKYNSAAKRRDKLYGLISYKNRKGIECIGYTQLKSNNNALVSFQNPSEALAFLENICKTHLLCPKHCQLTPPGTDCGNSLYSNCLLCKDLISIDQYNENVLSALQSIENNRLTKIFEFPGRTVEEKAFVWIKEGQYQGYGFVEDMNHINSEDEIDNFLIPHETSLNVRSILKNLST
ncbi:MAG: exonuclease domain-containing protein [Weeksellaceae bacterium]|nr:exonuclease domain-containing protein [Weeksellaceae bacterium]